MNYHDIIAKLNLDKKKIIIILIIAFVFFGALYFTFHNEGFYRETIAKIKMVDTKVDSHSTDIMNNKENIYKQSIKAIIMNGKYKNNIVNLENTTSDSKAFDYYFKVGDEVFIMIPNGYYDKSNDTPKITGVKRDMYIVMAAIIFIVLITLIGGLKGFKSLISLISNIIIFTLAMMLYLSGANLILVSIIASILFILVSLILVSGINKKTLVAVLSTLIGTAVSMLIALIVILLTKGNGIHYEEMEFLTRPPEQIFMMEILIGTLGGIMDIAISISASIKELLDQKPSISKKELIESGREIGNDIMGTMINTLFFAYICGSIPMIILWLKNGLSIAYITKVGLSLEVVRALTGSIGIIVSIPITLYIATIFFRRSKEGDKA